MKNLALTAVAVAILSGCGGSGDSKGGSQAPTTPDVKEHITTPDKTSVTTTSTNPVNTDSPTVVSKPIVVAPEPILQREPSVKPFVEPQPMVQSIPTIQHSPCFMLTTDNNIHIATGHIDYFDREQNFKAVDVTNDDDYFSGKNVCEFLEMKPMESHRPITGYGISGNPIYGNAQYNTVTLNRTITHNQNIKSLVYSEFSKTASGEVGFTSITLKHTSQYRGDGLNHVSASTWMGFKDGEMSATANNNSVVMRYVDDHYYGEASGWYSDITGEHRTTIDLGNDDPVTYIKYSISEAFSNRHTKNYQLPILKSEADHYIDVLTGKMNPNDLIDEVIGYANQVGVTNQ
ncbi:hypothetical protein JCM19241_25 [Vibrio ishigakensis]|uniref:Uncharacterized protein n=1 Tax=Vibrio ishigakensis TaxID=1481914 RepID=A0A0B8QJF8_9VIBR|nr:hypothetical protein JCM19241_25 [Vibrio ishigakensis]